jgi:hypothetical protein
LTTSASSVGAVERSGAEVLDDLVEALRQPGDLALRHPLDAELLHQLLDAPGRDAGGVGVGDHRDERLLCTPAGLQQPVGEVAALAQLRHRELDRRDARVPVALPVAVPAVDPTRRPLAVAGAADSISIGAPQRLGKVLDLRPHQIRLASSSCLRNQLESSIVRSTTVLLLAESLDKTSRGWRGGQPSPDPPQPLRARLPLPPHAYGGDHLNRLVHHERGRYFPEARRQFVS